MTNIDETTPDERGADMSRRVVLRGAALGGLSLPLLAACGSGDDGDSAEASPGKGGPSQAGSGPVPTSKVPVGGGVILTDQDAVVTQPTQGEFKAFTAICTHQRCHVGEVSGGRIICPCHGSQFSIEDGSPVTGPANQALAAKKVAVKGSEVTVT